MINSIRWIQFAAIGWCAMAGLIRSPMAFAQELRIPGFTAYILPDPHAVRVSENRNVHAWKDPKQSIHWYGSFSEPGLLKIQIEMAVQQGIRTRFKLTLDDVSHEVEVEGLGDKTIAVADFGEFEITRKGFHHFQLESLNDKPGLIADVLCLVLNGPATSSAHFNLKERRNAASVHLAYPVTKGKEVEAFYCEVTAVEDPTATFYMACGWNRGYFGMQVNSPTERRIIFSVWDSGNEAIDRNNVNEDDRVKLIRKGEQVYSGDFGNEGTGGHSHLKVLWKTGEVQKFVVTAEPVDKTFTIYSGYWCNPSNNQWMLISSWKAPKEGGRLRGLHSFSENFDGSNGHLVRKALYGNQWIKTPEDEWIELTSATFSHDATGKSDRLDRFMGVEKGCFFLSHGGFVEGYNKFGDPFERPAWNRKPELEQVWRLKK